jgi:malate dehydrogenase (oxaloacetate-decarboxylating)(NADP+)
MKIAAVEAIAALAREAPSEVAARAYGGEAPTFGPGSLIPNPFDPRLILRIAPALAEAAMASGVATRPIADMDAYRARLNEFVFRSGFIMKPLFAQAKSDPKRIVYAEGEDERVLRATQVVVEEGLAKPILIGRPAVIEARLERFGLAIRPERDFVLINPSEDPRYRKYVDLYIEAAGRRGVTPDTARTVIRTNSTVIAAAMVRAGDADAALCGVEGGYMGHLRHIRDLIGTCPGVDDFAALSLLITGKGNIFLADTQVRTDPTAEGIAEVAVLAAAHIRRFGIEPRIALVSHSDFGSYDSATARKMRAATALLWERKVDFEVDGEMHADSALDPHQRERVYPHSRLTGAANALILPTLDAANIAYEAIKTMADALAVGPILIGTARPAHILTPSVTARGIVNMTAVAVVEAQACAG